MTTITRRSGVTATAGTGPRLAYLTNLVNNPRAVNTTGLSTSWGSGGSGATSLVASGGPLTNCRTFYRTTWTTSPVDASAVQIRNGTLAGINPVTPGKKYIFKVYVRSSAALTIAPKMGWFSDAAYISIASGSPVTLVPNKWTPLASEGVAPAGAARLQMNTDPNSASIAIPAGATIDVSAWFAYETTGSAATDGAPAYADGDSAGWSWLGEAHASASQGYGAVLSQ